MPLPTKVINDDDSNRPRSPEIFLGGPPGIQTVTLTDSLENATDTNTMEIEEGINVPEKNSDENNDDKQNASSEDSEEDSDDDIVVAAGNFTLSSMENNIASLSQQNITSQSTAGINLKRNNLLTLTNIPGMSAGSKVSKIKMYLFSFFFFNKIIFLTIEYNFDLFFINNIILKLFYIVNTFVYLQHQGKFNVEDFESMGTINGVPAHEYSIETTEEKPWLKPGADITGKLFLL